MFQILLDLPMALRNTLLCSYQQTDSPSTDIIHPLTCSICNNIAWTGVHVSPEGTYTCVRCSDLESIDVHCPFIHRGCTYQGPATTLVDHLSGCPCLPVPTRQLLASWRLQNPLPQQQHDGFAGLDQEDLTHQVPTMACNPRVDGDEHGDGVIIGTASLANRLQAAELFDSSLSHPLPSSLPQLIPGAEDCDAILGLHTPPATLGTRPSDVGTQSPEADPLRVSLQPQSFSRPHSKAEDTASPHAGALYHPEGVQCGSSNASAGEVPLTLHHRFVADPSADLSTGPSSSGAQHTVRTPSVSMFSPSPHPLPHGMPATPPLHQCPFQGNPRGGSGLPPPLIFPTVPQTHARTPVDSPPDDHSSHRLPSSMGTDRSSSYPPSRSESTTVTSLPSSHPSQPSTPAQSSRTSSRITWTVSRVFVFVQHLWVSDILFLGRRRVRCSGYHLPNKHQRTRMLFSMRVHPEFIDENLTDNKLAMISKNTRYLNWIRPGSSSHDGAGISYYPEDTFRTIIRDLPIPQLIILIAGRMFDEVIGDGSLDIFGRARFETIRLIWNNPDTIAFVQSASSSLTVLEYFLTHFTCFISPNICHHCIIS